MPSPMRGVAFLLLPLLSVAAFYCLWIVAGKNGLFNQINDITGQEQPLFPGSQSPLMLKYTGIAPVDRQLSTLVTFFGPVVQQGDEALNLFSLFGLGQFGGAWALLLMESFRRGNQGKAVSFIGTYGFFVQNISFAISTPLYLLVHLLTSPTAKPYTAVHASSDLFVSSYDLAVIPISVTLGYIIPSLLIVYPVYAPVASPMHQYLVAFWQAFPLWTVLVQWILRSYCILTFGKDAITTTEKSSQATAVASKKYLENAGRLYMSILALCSASHLPAIILSLISPGVIPEAVAVLTYMARPSFTSTFIPPLPLGQPIMDMAEGVHIFLLWDMYIGSAAGVLWAITLYQNVPQGKQNTDSNISVVGKSILWTIIGGPVAAWTILMWERDKLVCQKLKV